MFFFKQFEYLCCYNILDVCICKAKLIGNSETVTECKIFGMIRKIRFGFAEERRKSVTERSEITDR